MILDESVKLGNSSGKKSILINSLQYIFFGLLGGFLCYMAFKDQNSSQLLVSLKEVNYWWVIPIFIISLVNSLIRSLRWLMLIKTLGYRPGVTKAFSALMIGYMVNYAVPRMGEITRCIVLKKSGHIPFEGTFGTVITERIIDILSLFLVCILTLVIAYKEIYKFVYDNIFLPIGQSIQLLGESILWLLPFIIIVTCAVLAILWIFRKKILAFLYQKKIRKIISDVWKGIASVRYVENKGMFIMYTLLIWFNYFLVTYIWFFAMDDMTGLNMKTGLVMTTLGSIGKSLPIQGGGVGAYHYIITQAGIIFGVSELNGNTLAIINHGFQTIFQIGFGLIGFLLVAKNIKVLPGNTRQD
ncbi:lysylphosphatidylglycerol synthase transmembrane domain-containing protein [Chondrinema litorale]|uniref:lysylphosphatidylglycerol synthase transmembrane domain-containing protein n=1 Tax=Chondrinema litorale TaxID=2994555 RepID=UPI0025436E89|nr:lysylphosphatidylglycerol synthase transmembrane domain-containing protein [Chondrinema litorale]UZR92401.1 lysylphosphatidylglycerol synthase transmembrane domain-containing protein [Chondrinema litorale]